MVWGNVTYSSAIDTSQSVAGFGTTVDDDGNHYVVGKHHTSFSIDGYYVNKTTNSGSDVFLLKFYSNGTLAWGTVGSTNGNCWGSGVALGPNGTVYITGLVDGSIITFGNNSVYGTGLFVAKFSSWDIFGQSLEILVALLGGLDIVVDSTGNAYVSGMNSTTRGPCQNRFKWKLVSGTLLS